MANDARKAIRAPGIRQTEIPRRRFWEFTARFLKTFDLLLFKILQVLDLYRVQKAIIGIPSLATRSFTLLQAVVYNGTQEEVLGYRPRRWLYRLVKGLPDVELFERVRFQVALSENQVRTVDASTEGRGFMLLQLPWQMPEESARATWLRLSPLGIDSLAGRITLGEYEVFSAPVFFLNSQIKRIIISDIDDTIKDSKIRETTGVRQILRSLFKGHYYRFDALEGMSEFYQTLNRPDTLVIYVTSTPFQLAAFLLKFLRDNRFPEGPVFMRWLGYGGFGHKYRTLSKILTQVDGQRVYCIGDSGEEDLAIYRRVAQDHGRHMEKILIRHVPGSSIPTLQPEKEVLYRSLDELKAHFDELS